jgi:DNA modification methylase
MTYELHLGDCLEYMKTMPDKSVDAVITDPPYGIGENSKKNSSRSNMAIAKDYQDGEWDKKRIGFEFFEQIIRVSREQVIFGGNYYTDFLPPSSSWVVWDKRNGANDFADCELAWTSHKKAVRKIEWMWNGMIRQGNEERFHLTQKPLGVMKWIIENYSPAGATIFDPFMGSGTTGVACVQLGRNFIGCEIDEKYFEIAKRRIEQAAMQEPLFT